jgi:hypothetical protein
VSASKQAFFAVIIANAAIARIMMDPLIEEYYLIVMDRLGCQCHQQSQTFSDNNQEVFLVQAPLIHYFKIKLDPIRLKGDITKPTAQVARAPS